MASAVLSLPFLCRNRRVPEKNRRKSLPVNLKFCELIRILNKGNDWNQWENGICLRAEISVFYKKYNQKRSSLLRTMEMAPFQRAPRCFPISVLLSYPDCLYFFIKKGKSHIFSTKKGQCGAMVTPILIVRSSLHFF